MRPLPIAPYRSRRTGPLGVVTRAGWRLKLIGISASDWFADSTELAAALELAEQQLPQPARTFERPGIAFLIVHRGEDALWVLINWWELSMLHQKVYSAQPGTTDLKPLPTADAMVCVWELLVIDHERAAWVTHVLTHPDSPDDTAYLESYLTVEV